MYAPAFLIGKERFIFAYKDQMFEDKTQAEMRGRELVFWFSKSGNPIEYIEAVDISSMGRRPVITVKGFKVCMIDRPEVEKKRNERSRRKTRSVP